MLKIKINSHSPVSKQEMEEVVERRTHCSLRTSHLMLSSQYMTSIKRSMEHFSQRQVYTSYQMRGSWCSSRWWMNFVSSTRRKAIIWWRTNSKKYLTNGLATSNKDKPTTCVSHSRESWSILKMHRGCNIKNSQRPGTNTWVTMNKQPLI